MKQFLLPHLVCPACLPAEITLDPTVKKLEGDDIITGELFCKKCRRRFPVKEGIAILLPEPDSYTSGGQSRYEERDTLNRYLWSHYADLTGTADGGETNKAWAGCLADNASSAFDAGCATGRLTFEMAARSTWAAGCDLSLNFVRMARKLAHERRLTFSLPLEGHIREVFRCELPAGWRTDNLEFVVANAQAVPFARGTFQQISSLNLLDRVNYPLAHLYEMNRVAQPCGASFLFADPFSWSASPAPEERWLGGTTTGKFAGRGVDNVRGLLTGKDGIIVPAWEIIREGNITWKMRSHINHCELITSNYICAAR